MPGTLLLLAIASTTFLIAAPLPARFHVRETAGLRRFSYPVRTIFKPPDAKATFRLMEEDKPTPAQFTPTENGRVEIDFNVSLGPLETRNFRVEQGSSPPSSGGTRIEAAADSYIVRNGIEITVPKDLSGFLNAVKSGPRSYLMAGGRGLVVRLSDGTENRLDAATCRIVKAGPLVCALRCETSGPVASVIRMEFPRSKSWVETSWTIADPKARVAAMAVELNMNLESEPALVDFGAGSMVYVALKKGQGAAFTAGPPSAGRQAWSILVGGQKYAEGTSMVEGWAHAMDRDRATAIALAGFGRAIPGIRDHLSVEAGGRTEIRRDLTKSGARTMKFWMHFVSTPVQLGAATSPQSMLNPPEVVWQ